MSRYEADVLFPFLLNDKGKRFALYEVWREWMDWVDWQPNRAEVYIKLYDSMELEDALKWGVAIEKRFRLKGTLLMCPGQTVRITVKVWDYVNG